MFPGRLRTAASGFACCSPNGRESNGRDISSNCLKYRCFLLFPRAEGLPGCFGTGDSARGAPQVGENRRKFSRLFNCGKPEPTILFHHAEFTYFL
ncbi:MAG: hypothetical protein AMJ54_13290 [Deltaproteobacteria bacterium SG8_13]|nr:MAG: hypothetical protein AMJ54_13290 [Deltaproteobacteria bacterium SG8_13]